MAEIQEKNFTAALNCKYFVKPAGSPRSGFTVFALHGYGMDAITMLRLAATWFPEQRIISIEAPHPFYINWEKREVGYSWAAHTRSEQSVRLHHEMLLQVFRESQVDPCERLLLGFSQPVGLNYRFAATHPGEVRGIIGVCGGVPKDWEDGAYGHIDAALLHIARTEDEAYPIALARDFKRRLSLRSGDVEYLELPGGHRFPSLARVGVLQWVEARFGDHRSMIADQLPR